MPRITDGRKAGAGYYEPSESRVSWAPLSERLDWTGVRSTHSRRPSVEHVPRLQTPRLRRMGAEAGVIARLDALEGSLSVTVALKAEFPVDPNADGRLRVLWDDNGTAYRFECDLVPTLFKRGTTRRLVTPVCFGRCPHCGNLARMLYWAVETFGCLRCVGLKPETRRLSERYAALKKVNRALAEFEDARGERRRKMVRGAWDAQVLLAEAALKRGK